MLHVLYSGIPMHTRHDLVMRAIGGTQATAYRDNLIANARRGARGAAAAGLWQN